jgi:hypothetical protein
MTAAAFQQSLPGLRGKVADEYRFSHIKFGRDLYKFFANEKANVAHLASLLAVPVYWGYDFFEVSQGKLGALLVDVCGVDVAPSRRSVSGYLARLSALGFIQIPRKRSLDSVKRYRFTDKFKAILDPQARQKMWDMQLHGKEGRTSSVGIKPQSTDHSETIGFNTNKNRAINMTKTSEPETAVSQTDRAGLDNINRPETKKAEQNPKQCRPARPQNAVRPAKPRNGHAPAKLSKFENSVRWWMFGFTGLASVAEAEILVALFLELNAEGTDDFINQLRGNWNKSGGKGETMTEAERSYNIRCLVGHLRTVRDDRAAIRAATQAAAAAPAYDEREISPSDPGVIPGAVREFSPEEKRVRVAKLEQAFHCALIFGDKSYTGPGAEIIERFRNATEAERDQILDDLHAGRIKPV